MTIQQLIYFREIAKTLHFTKASENLFVTQSSISHAISALEHELGVSLFTRQNGKKVVLTHMGEEFLPYVNLILDTVDKSKERIDQLRNPFGGVVRVAYGYVNGISLISRLFRDFNNDEHNKDISIQLHINNVHANIEKQLTSGEVNLAFTATPDFPGLNSIAVAEQELAVILPKEHPLSSMPSLTLKDLRDEPLVCYNQGGNLSRHIIEMFAEEKLIPNICEYQADWSAALAYISSGMGIGIMPRIPVVESMVSIVPLKARMNRRKIYMYWSKSTPLSPAVEYVREYCIRYFDPSAKP